MWYNNPGNMVTQKKIVCGSVLVKYGLLKSILLFKKIEYIIDKLKEDIDKKGQKISKNLFFTKQTVQNACGAIAIIHALANNADVLTIDSIYVVL